MISFTEEQAASLVTDLGTLKRGRELAGPAKWTGLGRTDTAAWGECAGSGSKPYLTGIDLTEPAFKCSCPSRVFPCKHGAGLLLLLARQPALLPASAPPSWLADWLDKRQAKHETQAAKTVAPGAAPSPALALPAATPPEPATAAATAQQKREAQRHARMRAGAEDLEAWLVDLLRAGLAEITKKPPAFWESQAARLVDNQLPGLATAVRELAAYPTAGAGWSERLLGRLGEVYVLLRAFRNQAALAPAARAEVMQQVGITPKKEDLLADPAIEAIADTWLVLGQFTWPEDRVTGRRSWLRGQHSGRTVLVLEFAFGSQPFATPLVPLARYAGEVCYYPGLLPLRVVARQLTPRPASAWLPIGQGVTDFLEEYADALARQPWLRDYPAHLAAVVPLRLGPEHWVLRETSPHSAGSFHELPLRLPDEQAGWHLLAVSGGQPLAVFGEWDGRAFRPLSHWATTEALPA